MPVIIGQINAGLMWPQGFSQAENKKPSIDKLRNLYCLLTHVRYTHRRAVVNIANSLQTYVELASVWVPSYAHLVECTRRV